MWLGLYLGRPFFNQQFGGYWYNTGGPGYILDRVALKVNPCSLTYLLVVILPPYPSVS